MQQDVTDHLNISRQAYCRYENNQKEVLLNVLEKLVKLFEETTGTLLVREPL